MNEIAKNMREVMEAADYLKHVGVGHDDNPPGRGSGRFAYGSGKNAYQRLGREFYEEYKKLKESGLSEKEIAEELGCYDIHGKPSTGILRDMRAVAKNNVRKENVRRAHELRDQGYTLNDIAKELGLPNESSVRSLLNGTSETNMLRAEKTADELKRVLEERGKFIDIGAGVEGELSAALDMNISETRLSEAIYMLKQEGYVVENVLIPQANNAQGQKTTVRVLAPPGTDIKDLRDYNNIVSYKEYISYDDGDTLSKAYEYPSSLDPSRLMVIYAEDGGKDKDGVIEIRRGVADLDLKGSHYCQTRILVNGTHYLKGMAVYGDDMPPGVDVIFNTNKTRDVPVLGEDKNNTVLKKIKTDDPDNPFGSLVKDISRGGQYYYIDSKTGEKKLGLINKTRDEGDWDDWSDASPSQFISKQPKALIDRQLNLTIADKKSEFEDIMSVTNPTLRKKLLIDFAGKCDKAAEDLKAAALPGQKYRVILPLKDAKDNEIYAPNLNNGTTVALVRFPHTGPHEIPILRVNNNIKEGDRVITKNAVDAVGINAKTASILSGADFDGDTVLVIPMSNSVRIASSANERVFKELRDFDPHTEYAYRPGMKEMTKSNTQREMGIISNLITDMYIRGASAEDLIKATKHSMVVIDAEKHHLDYKRSEKENDIDELKRKYQIHIDPETGEEKYGGASTIISSAKSEVRVTKRQGAPRIDKKTGDVWYQKADDAVYINKKGEKVEKTTPISKMEYYKDAFELVSDVNNPIEVSYAKFANTMKETARQARLTAVNTKDVTYSKSAYLAFKSDVDDLMAQVREAEANRPRERYAQTLANSEIQRKMKIWKNENPAYSDREYKEQKKKIATKELSSARIKVGASRKNIVLTDRQWQAINLNAINQTNLNKIFKYADMDDVRSRAMPRDKNSLSDAKVAKLKAMKASGYSNAEIANALGVSRSTVSNYVKEEIQKSVAN